MKNRFFSRIGLIAWIRCVSLDSIALKSMWELYINSISSDIDGERCASDLAGGEACASRWVWRSVGIDDRSRGSRNHENHKKTLFFDLKSIFSKSLQMLLWTSPKLLRPFPDSEISLSSAGMSRMTSLGGMAGAGKAVQKSKNHQNSKK